MKGQNVYKEHLPLLGELGPGRTGPHGLQVGDQVGVCVDMDNLYKKLVPFLYVIG